MLKCVLKIEVYYGNAIFRKVSEMFWESVEMFRGIPSKISMAQVTKHDLMEHILHR